MVGLSAMRLKYGQDRNAASPSVLAHKASARRQSLSAMAVRNHGLGRAVIPTEDKRMPLRCQVGIPRTPKILTIADPWQHTSIRPGSRGVQKATDYTGTFRSPVAGRFGVECNGVVIGYRQQYNTRLVYIHFQIEDKGYPIYGVHDDIM